MVHPQARNPSDTTAALAGGILEVIGRLRNACPDSTPSDDGPAHHAARIEQAIRRDEPITLILPAFPAKSANPRKTLGVLPDYGEVLALRRLQRLCGEIGELYAPGARLIICADGRVFSDLVQVSDEAVTAYARGIERIIETEELQALSTFDLDDLLPRGLGHDRVRQALVDAHGEPLADWRSRIRLDPDARRLYNGIHRFLFEDLVVLRSGWSRQKVRTWSAGLAYQVIQRSGAWSNLLSERFPHAVRLSIHPQPLHSRKIGVRLLPSDNLWRTPWHSVALFDGRQFTLVRRQDAEAMGALLVRAGGEYAYFVAPPAPEGGDSHDARVIQ